MTSLVTRSLALLLAALASACAVDSGTASSAEPSPTREYRTGSNIPVREPRSTSAEKARAAAPADPARPADPAVKPTN